MIQNTAIRQALYVRLNRAPLTVKPNQSTPRLLANGAASIFHSVAPAESPFPFLVYFKVSGTLIGMFGGRAVDAATVPEGDLTPGPRDPAIRDQIWTVKAVASATAAATAEAIDKAVHDLLHHANLPIVGADDGFKEPATTRGAATMLVARVSDVEYTETVGDSQYRHCGGNYRLVVQDA